jgi:hypothetical protein
MNLYHYTEYAGLGGILSSGYIDLSNSEAYEGIPPAVWLSKSHKYEATSREFKFAPTAETPQDALILVSHVQNLVSSRFRIKIDPNLKTYSFEEYISMTGIDTDAKDKLISIGKDLDSDPNDWYVTFETIKKESFIGIHALVKDKWNVEGKLILKCIAVGFNMITELKKAPPFLAFRILEDTFLLSDALNNQVSFCNKKEIDRLKREGML